MEQEKKNNGRMEKVEIELIEQMSLCKHCGCIVAESYIPTHHKFHLALADLARTSQSWHPIMDAIQRLISDEE